MADGPEIVALLRDTVEARRKELRLKPGRLHELVGFATTTVDNIRKGYRRAYAEDVKWAVCAALQWTDDSIDRLLRGEAPQVLDAPRPRVHLNPPANPPMLAEIARQLEVLDGKVSEVLDVLGQRDEKVAALASGLEANHKLLSAMLPLVRALKPAPSTKATAPRAQPSGRKRNAGHPAGRSAAERNL